VLDGEIKKEGKSTFQIEFKNCYLVERSKELTKRFLTACAFGEPIIAKGTDELIEHGVDKFIGKGVEEEFAEVKIKAKLARSKATIE
jgi:hypothetical protein